MQVYFNPTRRLTKINWVKISLYTEFQLHRLPGSRTASFALNPICGGGGEGGSGDPDFFLDISSSWVEINLHTEFQLPSMPEIGSSMVGDKKKKKSVGI